jgi:hypothetical protein
MRDEALSIDEEAIVVVLDLEPPYARMVRVISLLVGSRRHPLLDSLQHVSRREPLRMVGEHTQHTAHKFTLSSPCRQVGGRVPRTPFTILCSQASASVASPKTKGPR